MSEEKQITAKDVKKLLIGLDPITRKNLLSRSQKMTFEGQYQFVQNYLRSKGLDSKEGMEAYQKSRKNGCKGCSDKK